MEIKTVCSATDGGDGGLGGIVEIAYASSMVGTPSIDASGGAPGKAGDSVHGASARSGSGGDGGTIDLAQDASYVFDGSAIPKGAVMTVGIGAQTVLTDSLEIETLHLGPGAFLEIGGDLHFVIGELVIEEGATLRLRGRTKDDLVISTPNPTLTEPGLGGAYALIDAGKVDLRGTIDVAGNDGGASGDGGTGGDLEIRAETISFGASAKILANGGDGGDGEDERACP